MADNLVIMEEMEELPVSPTGTHPCLTTDHFLDAPVSAPSLDSSPLRVDFLGWKTPKNRWKTWVDQMHALHHSIWKNVGILHAIMNSKRRIAHRHQDLVLGLVCKWRPSTNTVVFPWGEATITLEDVMVLGGYPVLGESVFFDPPHDEDAETVMKKFHEARAILCRTKARKASQCGWIAKFMGGGSEIEHEAFLAYWLSRFVFPFTRDTLIRSVLPIALHLARGTRIALAPPVLACIYNSLTLLKRAAIVASRKKPDYDEVTVSGSLALVQIWAWERFPSLRPNPISIGEDEPRLGRWHNLKNEMDIRDVLLRIDSGGEEFEWRPYTSNVVPGRIYKDYEYWAKVDSDLQGLLRCLTTSDLVSLAGDCAEHYLPHRVAKQFGVNQDLLLDLTRKSQYRKNAKFDPEQVGGMRRSPLCSTADYNGDHKAGFSTADYNGDHKAGFSGKGSYCKASLKRKFVESSSDYNRGVSPPPGFAPNHDNRVINSSDHSGYGIEKMVADASSNIGIHDNVNNYECEDDDDGEGMIEALGIGSLEERIRKVEKLYALLKAENSVCI